MIIYDIIINREVKFKEKEFLDEKGSISFRLTSSDVKCSLEQAIIPCQKNSPNNNTIIYELSRVSCGRMASVSHPCVYLS